MERNGEKRKPTVIAVCGKGGVGKTSVSALLTRMLLERTTSKVFAIDADPAVGLSYPLGIKVKRTVDNIRNDLIDSLSEGDKKANREELIKRLDYEIFDALEEKDRLAFLAIGRPEGDGCYCQVNNLLKDIIKEIAFNFDFVIIDAEAGVEQINRRVMQMVTHLFLVSDASIKGKNVATTIDSIARKNAKIKKSGLFLNRIKDKDESDRLENASSLPIIGWMSENELIRTYDRDGKSFFDLPNDPAFASLEKTAEKFLWN